MHSSVSPKLFRKALAGPLSEKERRLLKLLYESDDYVPDSKLRQELGVDARGVGGVMGSIKERLTSTGEIETVDRDEFFRWMPPSEEGAYRLLDHLRPVVREILSHEKEAEESRD